MSNDEAACCQLNVFFASNIKNHDLHFPHFIPTDLYSSSSSSFSFFWEQIKSTVHILTRVCFEAIKTACRAERACFTGNVKSIENCSWRWGDATWEWAGVCRCISCSWFSWLRTWYWKSVLGKTWLFFACKKKKEEKHTFCKLIFILFLKMMLDFGMKTHHKQSQWCCAMCPLKLSDVGYVQHIQCCLPASQ